MKAIMNGLQPLARALMLPIAVLPVAGLLLRLGQPDLLDIGFISAAGDAIFSHLGLLFAIGVATGFARDGNGAACLASVICFLVARNGAQALMSVPPDVTAGFAKDAAATLAAAWKEKAIGRLDVPIGILSGLAGGLLYNRYAQITLPSYLSFFGGRRFVPIVAGLVGVAMAALIGWGYEWLAAGVDGLSRAISGAGPIGLFLFGVLNRLLLITGLHHLLNNVVWFVVGDFHGTTGDLRRFFAGDPSAGGFMAGFFPVMMFGLPAACLAIYHTALPERRKAVGGMMLSLGLTSLLTGVTEPIEFLFIFLAPALFGVHAVLTGAAMVLMAVLGVKLGFGFSAGLIDYLLNFNLATRPLLLLPIGAAFAVIYYAMFRYAIVRFDLKTPGREPDSQQHATGERAQGDGRGAAFLAALGGSANLSTVGACTTRLRLKVRDSTLVDDAALRSLGALGIIRPSAGILQVVVGPIADQVVEEIRVASGVDDADRFAAPSQNQGSSAVASLPPALLAALGGPDNVRAADAFAGRFRVVLAKPAAHDDNALAQAGVRQAREIDGRLHLIVADQDA